MDAADKVGHADTNPAGMPERDCGAEMRRRRMAVIAGSGDADLEAAWARFDRDPQCVLLRGPETGLVALRGRIGGDGALFQFGEAVVTRAVVKLEDGSIGHALLLGRDKRKAKLAAVIDAMAHSGNFAAEIDAVVIAPLAAAQSARDARRQAETAATKVNFFTLVRGEDQ
jgi:alpha-D-ribose 1-methylphosphonate 5-triphosphate synthase subunit PhnG